MTNPAKLHFIGIGEMSLQIGVRIETIRYFEKIGMMPPPERSQGGNRQYSTDHLQRLFFINRCRQIGFNQSKIRALLSMVDNEGVTCAEVHSITAEQIGDIRKKIEIYENWRRY